MLAATQLLEPLPRLGVARAFGKAGGFRILDKETNEDITEEARSRHPEGPDAFDRMLAWGALRAVERHRAHRCTRPTGKRRAAATFGPKERSIGRSSETRAHRWEGVTCDGNSYVQLRSTTWASLESFVPWPS
jgi:hypothetical protein